MAALTKTLTAVMAALVASLMATLMVSLLMHCHRTALFTHRYHTGVIVHRYHAIVPRNVIAKCSMSLNCYHLLKLARLHNLHRAGGLRSLRQSS